MSTVNSILWIHAQTPLHCGSGTAMGVVDLPIQRERHTGWPIIPGSSLKGILRDTARHAVPEESAREPNTDPTLTAIFGPADSEHAGAVSVTDARLIAFPVRSLKGVFAWVTCPAAIERLHRDLKIAGKPTPLPVPAVAAGQCLCASDSPILVDGKAILEEFDFTRADADVSKWIADFAAFAVADAATVDRLKKHLVIIDDDHFTHFVKNATQVDARIALKYDTKTVRKGALFYEEFLPTESILYSVILASDSRKDGCTRRAADNQRYLADLLSGNPFLQIGGGETIGRGICALNLK